MNSKSMILLRTMWAATGRINVLKHSKSKQKKNAAMVMLSGYAVIAVFLALFIFYICMGLGKIGYPQMAADLTASMITLVALIFTLLKANAYLYAFKEYDMLMAMPFSVETVVTGRFLLMYFRDLPWNVLISFSALAGYAVSVHPGPAVYILWILLTPFLPLLPMTVSTLLGYLVARVGARVRHKTLIQTVLTFLVVLPVFAIQYIAEYIARNNLGDAVLEKSFATLSAMAMVIPTIGWFEKAVLSCDVLAALLLILVSVLLFAAVVFLITKNYRRINSALAAVSGRKKSKEGTKSYRQKSVVQSIAFKEFRRITGSTVSAVNLGLGTVFAILAGLILPFINFNSLLQVLAHGAPVNFDIAPFRLVWPVFVYFFVGMVPTTAPSPSLEGKSDWILKSMPVDPLEICKGRMLFNLYANLIPGLFAVFGGMISMRADLPDFLLGFAMITAMVLFSTCFGMRSGLKHVNLDWENEIEVVKQGAAVSFYLLPNMFLTMALVGGTIGLCLTVGGKVAALLIILLYAVFTYLSYGAVKRLARKHA